MALTWNFTAAAAILALGTFATTSQANTFLRSGQVSLRDAERSLGSELAGTVSRARLVEFRDALRPTYAALPKNAHGHLGHQAVRYVLHRLFVQRHGWFIKGLEPDGDVWHTASSTASLKDWVPSYLLDRLEERVGGRGIDLDDLTAVGAALEDLIRQEALGRLGAVYRALGLPAANVSRAQAQDAMTTYLMVYLLGGNFSVATPAEALQKRGAFVAGYANWSAVETWLRGVERAHLPEPGAAAEPEIDFATASNVAVDVGARYGFFNDLECRDLKETLLGLQGRSKKAGRVRLPDFYKKGLYSHWGFTEKVGYLRALGALDETNSSQPMVIVPNYLGARPNCLEASSLYAVCCRNECEDLMGHLESIIAAPAAAPGRIAELVAALPSATVAAPRPLPAETVARLHGIAAVHGGEVNLHGRLFAQWMHHVFPNERARRAP